jgi:hypothetical protein
MNKGCLVEEGSNGQRMANSGIFKERGRQPLHFRIAIILKKFMSRMMAEWCTSAGMVGRIFLMVTTIIRVFIQKEPTANGKSELVVGAELSEDSKKQRLFMELLDHREESSFVLCDVEVSESELSIYRLCMRYVLQRADPKQIEAEFGAYPDEILGMLESVEDVMEQIGLPLEEEDMPGELAVDEK